MFGFRFRPICLLIGVSVWMPVALARGDGLDFFESRIRPVLVERCYECHSMDSDVVQGGLRVDSSVAMMRGGDSGPAIELGKPGHSLLLSAIRYEDMQMPPDQPLPADVIRDFEMWIEGGAAMPASKENDSKRAGMSESEAVQTPRIDWQQAQQHWAFQRPRMHDVDVRGAGSDTTWIQNKLDEFVVAKLRERGLQPNSPATKRAWLRRVTFDLVGLPPTIGEVNDFLSDDKPRAKRRVVDRLLASPHFAERWARLWLDVARYAEDQAHIVGNNDSLTYPNAYLYRDWVIDALAADMPYDEFIRQQLAADLLDPGNTDSHAALGFLGLGPKYYRRNDLEVMADEWEDRVDVVTRGLLGLTVACARCHDHKYDPIPTSDYYALAGVFASTSMFNRPLSDSVETKGDEAKKPQDAMHILREGTAQNLNIMIRGDASRLGPEVPRGFLTALKADPESPDTSGDESFQAGSGRIALANHIADRRNPLTARVLVNRVFAELTGTPLVDTPSNFGSLGSLPSHPKLLDDLAVRFMDAGWSMKWLVGEIVCSATYGQSSDVDPEKLRIDPDNRLRWRMPRRRISIEAYRDAVLNVSGGLESRLFGRSEVPNESDSKRRTVYSKVSRLDLNPMLARFDFPDPNAHSANRHQTTTPLQKLFLLNSPFMLRQASRLADRLQSETDSTDDAIHLAYQTLYSRPPSKSEVEIGQDFLSDRAAPNHDGAVEKKANRWVQFSQALLIANEMFMVD